MSTIYGLQPQLEEEREFLPDQVCPGYSVRRSRAGLDVDGLTREEQVKLVQRLFFLPGPEAPRVVLFCGVESGSGVTWVCAQSAETLASQVKGSVCLVDANLHTPFLHEYYGQENHSGLAEALLRSRPVSSLAHPVNGGNLWLLTCGSKIPDPHLVLTSDRLRGCLAELRQGFDYVLVDGPPVNLYANTALLGKLTDGVVLVVRANSTRREAARAAAESLTAAKVRFLGAVLNKRRFPIPEGLYRKI